VALNTKLSTVCVESKQDKQDNILTIEFYSW
jgi:hypothetical protein